MVRGERVERRGAGRGVRSKDDGENSSSKPTSPLLFSLSVHDLGFEPHTEGKLGYARQGQGRSENPLLDEGIGCRVWQVDLSMNTPEDLSGPVSL